MKGAKDGSTNTNPEVTLLNDCFILEIMFRLYSLLFDINGSHNLSLL